MSSGRGDVLVIREEYGLLHEALERSLETKSFAGGFGGFAVTGQPGIGKSTFLVYLLLRRLEKKCPTAVQFGPQEYFIFDEKGATSHHTDERNKRLESCWALADSIAAARAPCACFVGTAKCVVQATSPNVDRWKHWLKEREGLWVVMALPSVAEIAAVLKELNHDPAFALPFVQKWGPSTRQAIHSISEYHKMGALDAIANDVEGALQHISNFPKEVLTEAFLPRSDASNIIFVQRPPGNGIEFKTIRLYIPTRHLRERFETRLSQVANVDRMMLFSWLSSHALTRTAAGWMHERMMHERLGNGGADLVLFGGSGHEVMQTTKNILPGTLGGLGQANAISPFYWMPSVANFPGVDSVLGDCNGRLYTIQATIAADHNDPMEGIMKVWKFATKEVQEKRIWSHVVVADSEETAAGYVMELSKRLKGFTLGKGHVAVQVRGTWF